MHSRRLRKDHMPPWFSVLFIGMGAFIILLSLGILPYAPHPVSGRPRALLTSPAHWSITSAGVAFFCAGVAIGFQNRRHWLLACNGAVCMGALVSSLFWVLFLSGKVPLSMQIFGGVVLSIGVAGGVFGLVRSAQGKSSHFGRPWDPIAEAELQHAYGNWAQASEILTRAAQHDPQRAAEYDAKRIALQSAPSGTPRVVPPTVPGWFAIPVLSGILLPVFASSGSRWPELVGNTLFFGSIPAIVIWWWYQRSRR